MKKILLFVLLALTACKKEVKEELPVFYTFEARLEQRNKHPETNSMLPPPPPLVDYYTKHNFVIDSLGNVYYFQDKLILRACGTGLNSDSIYPAKFINLNPEKLIKVPSLGVEKFIKNTILSDTTWHSLKYISVGSEKDTFQSRDFSKALNVLDRSGKKVQLYQFRRTTQEESEVLKHKKLKIPYDHTQIKWDSARTTFTKYPL